MSPAITFRCSGCDASPADDAFPFACPNAGRADGIDHVLRREVDPSVLPVAEVGSEQNPFLAYRNFLYAYQLARGGGLSDQAFCDLVRELDANVAELDGRGFARTPFLRAEELSATLGFSDAGGVWIKDETGNVAGSHKARHLFDVMCELEVAEQIGRSEPDARAPLAIASCGNAALAAAVVAAAAGRRLEVFVPLDADPAVVERLYELRAEVTICERDGQPGDPTYRRLVRAIADGAVPFSCQGNLNGLAVEGGMTLGYELAADGVPLDRLIVQVGGGALASACYESLVEARALGWIAALPRIDTVQTESAWPLRRAFDAVREGWDGSHVHRRLREVARQRGRYMWPWETEPHSVAHGILDDETYDWLAVVEGMLETGGAPLVVDEAALVSACALARSTTGIPVDATGSAGLAGLVALHDAGLVEPDERVAVLFTGRDRAPHSAFEERISHEELPGQGHPVAQGL